MSVTDRDSGIAAAHIPKLEAACKALNVFLFIRPTEYDSTKLIQAGYATKSMSVHDKSSNWGPMAGFVPCDQFFSKKYIGNPNKTPVYHDHGPAKICHLRLTDELVNSHDKMVELPAEKTEIGTRNFKGKTTNPAASGIKFLLEKKSDGWDVYWLDGAKRVPLYVWGYVTGDGKKPVTGDYDLWMVAPHMSWWKLHLQIVGVNDEHGASCATLLNTWLLSELNKACARSDNPVFQHGAEAQNYSFTQSIDQRVAMVTPAGGSRMVERGDIAKILADLQSAAYLVYWNKRYGETDPQLSGKAFTLDGIQGGELKKLLDKVDGSGAKGILKHLAKKNETLRDIIDVKKFYAELKQAMLDVGTRNEPTFLKVGDGLDLPADYASRLGDDTLEAQKRLQSAVVQHGGGGSDIDAMERWIDGHIEDIAVLCEGYGAVPGADGLGPSSGFLLERIPGTKSYRRST